ncbi:hypothetical protein MKW98_005520 [Papaver atlanticum]|uniref:Secreted protein n=1 Tax=Papaver atlanticum TaxID=357466 RepID=A0AAD4T7L5_9MAGN|nr:hypothetical protein MKW98_005520 [Papaver atlanticum]
MKSVQILVLSVIWNISLASASLESKWLFYGVILIFEARLSCICGPHCNSKLLINYGFVDEDNPMTAFWLRHLLALRILNTTIREWLLSKMENWLYKSFRSLLAKNKKQFTICFLTFD